MGTGEEGFHNIGHSGVRERAVRESKIEVTEAEGAEGVGTGGGHALRMKLK